MSSDWEEYSLLDVFDVRNGLTKKREEFGFGFPFVAFKDVFNNHFIPEELDSLANTSPKEQKKYSIKRGDVLITRTSENFEELGMTSVALKDYPEATYNGFTKRLRPKKDKYLKPEYIGFFFRSPYFRRQILSLTTMTTRASLNNEMLARLKIKIPPEKAQDRIAETLICCHDKIHLNQQTNETLEAMAQAIFKSWFVDFDPVRAKIEARSVGRAPNRAAMAAIAGVSLEMDWDEIETTLQRKLDRMTEPQRAQLRQTAELFPDELVESEIGVVPKGWDIKPLDEIADYLNGRAMQKYPPENGKPTLPVLKIAQLRKGDTESADIATADIPEKFKVRDGDMIFSWSGSLLIRLWAGGDTALNQHLFKVTSEEYAQWFYYHWTKYHLDNFIRIAESKAVTMGHIKRSHLKEAKCAIPSRDLLEFGKQQIEPLLAQSLQSKIESRNLAELRDTLLPKLISGEIGV